MTATTISPTELRRAIDELEALETQQRAEQQRQAERAAAELAEHRSAELAAQIDHDENCRTTHAGY